VMFWGFPGKNGGIRSGYCRCIAVVIFGAVVACTEHTSRNQFA